MSACKGCEDARELVLLPCSSVSAWSQCGTCKTVYERSDLPGCPHQAMRAPGWMNMGRQRICRHCEMPLDRVLVTVAA